MDTASGRIKRFTHSYPQMKLSGIFEGAIEFSNLGTLSFWHEENDHHEDESRRVALNPQHAFG